MQELIFEDINYVKKSLLDVWDNLALLLVGNIFFCLFCVPSMVLHISDLILPAIWLGCFIIVPAFAGLIYMAGRIASGKRFGVKDVAFGFYHFYGRSVVIGGLITLLISLILVTLNLLTTNPDQSWLIFPLSIQFAALLFIALLLAYAFPLMTIYNTSLKNTFINAFLLATNYKIPAIGMLCMAVLFGFLIRWTKFGLILLCPVLWAVFASNITMLCIQKQLSPIEDDIASK